MKCFLNRILIVALFALSLSGAHGQAAEPIVYSVYKSIDMGDPNDPPQRDYYLTLGSNQGVQQGDLVSVFRRTPSYDHLAQKQARDMVFPIAKLKLIHVEENASIARLEKMLPAAESGAISPRAVLVGDLVRRQK